MVRDTPFVGWVKAQFANPLKRFEASWDDLRKPPCANRQLSSRHNRIRRASGDIWMRKRFEERPCGQTSIAIKDPLSPALHMLVCKTDPLELPFIFFNLPTLRAE